MAASRWARRAIPIVVGAAMVALLLDHVGWGAVHAAIASAGPWCLVVVVIDVAGLACDAAAIASFARPHAAIAYRRAFVAQATGYVINQLTPGNSLGEPVKVSILGAEAPRDVAISAIVLYNLATVVVGAAAIAFGAPFALLALDLPPALGIASWVGVGVVVAAVAGLFVALRRGLCATSIELLRRCRAIGGARAARWTARTATIDVHLRELGGPASRRGLGFACASRAASWLGTLVLLPALGVPLTAPSVLAVLSLGVLISWLSDAMPLGLGIADGGQCTLYTALGATPAVGLAVAMIGRARACLAGMVALAIAAVVTRGHRLSWPLRRAVSV
ncbi:MAG TPA: lysylphosphatidylglycerol synthase domain-containing protein [Kofleriaceae bacterium]